MRIELDISTDAAGWVTQIGWRVHDDNSALIALGTALNPELATTAWIDAFEIALDRAMADVERNGGVQAVLPF